MKMRERPGRWGRVTRGLVKAGCAASVGAIATLCPPAWAASAEEEWESLSVRELMQQDLRQALDEARRAEPVPSGGGRAAPVSARPILAPRLVALYGVGRALMAEVQVGRDAYLYVKGQTHPAGHAGDPGVYQLRGMNGACIQLERGDDKHSLCLRMLLGEVQP
ncbi:hypothetical protein CDEF62S_01246 [Castellaniella defragrans]